MTDLTDADRENPHYLVGRLYQLLKTAAPYVEKVAASNPTEWSRQQRQRAAAIDAKCIRDAIADIERINPDLVTAADGGKS